ncbi:alpha-amylase [Vallitalea longa]|uniref:Alpha-amylase n=1 Tax=Vallitalea longa TaxID=2936439 RepID=A0A9W6DFE8_9FIRM|nr:alpha-amylase family glycosyl hydrolase [Vallitalea longa]GKX30510.1 alpha-amylase [Vallitalea longa]
MYKKLVIVIIVLFMFSGCTSAKDGLSKNDREGIWYEIFVRSFADSNGDGVGDIKGLVDKLDYLNDNDPSTDDDLGIDGIWLMPINPSPSYHGYDITDYYEINTDYGTLDDFELLIEQAHKRGIKVIMDLVVNHSSKDHPWFKEAISDENSDYRDYYDIVSKDSEGYNFNKQVWGHKVWNKIGSNYYYAIFWNGMPDLNYNSEALREEVIDIAKFWLEKGVDGFRIDAVPHIFGSGELPRNESHDDKIQDWWNEFDTSLRNIYPDYYLVGEVWEPINTRASYAKYFDTTFNFDLSGNSILGMVKNEIDINGKNNEFNNQLEKIYTKINEYSDNFIDAPFLSNHDMQRSMDYLNGDLSDMKLAASIYMTLPGNPFIYYGEEIGMKGNKPDENIREPFIWGDNDNYQTSWEPLSSNENTPNVVEQDKETDSLLNYYRTIIRVRQNNRALMSGEFRGIETHNQKVVAYERNYQDESLVVVHNLSSEDIEIYKKELEKKFKLDEVIFSNPQEPIIKDNIIRLSGKSTTIFRVK